LIYIIIYILTIAKTTNDEIAEDKLIEMRTINAHERRLETDETMLKQGTVILLIVG
jgi:hypothetical protein